MALIIPKKIRKGDSVGFISPSAGVGGLAPHRVENAKKTLESLGYKVKIGKNAMKNSGYISSFVEDRIDDIHSMFLDPEIKMIMCIIGGNNSNHLIKHLDYGLIRKNPKIFIGYSDITVLHFALHTQANLATYYGPCAMTQFGEFPKILDYTLDYFNRELSAENHQKKYEIQASELWTSELLDWFKKTDLTRARKLEKNTGYEWLKKGTAKGKIAGGAILSINHLAGTKYWINPKGKVYFLDILKADELNEGAVDALLTDLDNMDFFNEITGLVVGRPADYTSEETQRLKELIIKYSGKKKYPILFNTNIGHTDPIITIRYGRDVVLDSRKNLFAFV
ncbi:MAG: hypothetical protein UV40_C0001G0015 [Parcubacteria group bacterium GW2011_GWA1_42_7]|nr:MAG: hypothetical protein UV34_C0012G0020 [Parcubacteria group bacterium GW2011_GWB1_42_6]KKS70246.1 MAG: hypothetical protein UV40_C0001G0015 [Parcubacteria group bacterium GW2011_GWA1_42_7]KKS92579.1 MAG: hypothetical protein UV67_C0001G0019 [Parcubacteria group bacterium GW2011_GWC1_43_12]